MVFKVKGEDIEKKNIFRAQRDDYKTSQKGKTIMQQIYSKHRILLRLKENRVR